MPTLLIRHGYKFRFYALDVGEPPHVHIVKDGKSLKVWLKSLEVAQNKGYSDQEIGRLLNVASEHRDEWIGAWDDTSLAFETDEMQPVRAWCAGGEVCVALADGHVIAKPLWWYPFLSELDDGELNDIELMYEGIWWTAIDEGISVKSMFLGIKAPGAKAPERAA